MLECDRGCAPTPLQMLIPLLPSVSTPSRPTALPYLAMGMGILALGFSALFVRWANAPGPVTGFYRMSLGSLILTPLVLRRRNPRRTWSKTGLLLAMLGGIFLAVDLALWNTSINLTSAANATLFGNAAPLWVALAAPLLFGERLRGRFWLGLMVTLAGGAIVAGSDFMRHPRLGSGDLLALSASLFYAGYFLSTQRGRKELDSLTYVWVACASSGVCLLAITRLLGQPLTGYPPQTYLAFLGTALVSQTLGYVCVGYALGHLPASFVSPTMVGQPVMTALLAVPFLGEHLTGAQLLGGGAVIAGILLVHRSRNGPGVP